MAELTKIRDNSSVLLGDIQAHLLAESRKPSGRSRDVVHPSEMAKSDWCERQTFYRISNIFESNPQADKTSFQLAGVFEEGHQIHRKWQTWLWEMGRLWGLWFCQGCKKEFFATSPLACEYCNSVLLVYKEVPLTDSDNRSITGHADGAILDLKALIEIKSVGLGTLRFEQPSLLNAYYLKTDQGHKIYDLDGIWRDIKSPFPSHLRQANIYLYLARIMGLPYDRMIFLYEFKANQNVKEFTVKESSTILNPLLDRVANLRYALEVETPPRRPSHTGKDKKVCKTCPWFDKCYQEEGNNAASIQNSPNQVRLASGGISSDKEIRKIELGFGDQAGRESTTVTGGTYGIYRSGSNEPVYTPDQLVPVGRPGYVNGRNRREVRRRSISKIQGT